MPFDERSDFAMEFARDSRGEDRAARRYATEWCPSGRHVVRSDGRGGGQCECGFEVGRDEL